MRFFKNYSDKLFTIKLEYIENLKSVPKNRIFANIAQTTL